MTLFLPPKKIIQASWDAVIAHGSKRQRSILRFFVPHFVARRVSPGTVTDNSLREICGLLPQDAARDYFKQPAQTNHYAANGFVGALADIETRHCLGLPSLTGFPAQDAEQRAAKGRFEAAYKKDLDQLFGTYRLPDTFCETREDGTLAPRADKVKKLGELVSSGNRAGIINGLYAAYGIACAGPGAPKTLSDLHRQPLLAAILRATRADDNHGAAIQILRAVAQVAAQDANVEARDELNATATQIHERHGGNGVRGDLLRRLQRFNDVAAFQAFGRALVRATQVESYKDLRSLPGLTRVTSALASILAISAPASFEIINSMTFSGPEYEGRPELQSPRYGSLETPLNPAIRGLLTDFYFSFRTAHGVYPQSILPGKDGLHRPGGNASVNTFLKNLVVEFSDGKTMRVDLTASELRDLGVFRMAWGDDADETMAKAARVSDKYFRDRFRLMVDHVKASKRRRR